MGLRITLNDMDFSDNNIGNIFDVPIEGVSISKVDGAGNYFTIVPTYTPANTTETGLIYSIVSGDATINENVVSYNSTGSVTVRCESNINPNVYDEQTFSVTYEDRNIVFQDALVKQILVANFDTSGDGEISIDEAANASPIRIDATSTSIFKEHNNDIEYFEEFKYFTKTTDLKIVSSSLKTIELPSSITTVTKITSTTPNFASLESFVFNSKIAELPELYFTDSSIEDIEVWATSVKAKAFLGSSIKNVKFKEGLESIEGQVFHTTSTLSIDLPSTVTDVSGQLLRSTSMPKLIIRATTPPTWASASSYGAPSDLAIYVPDASVDAYKAATGWSSVDTKIHPLSDIENS